MHSTGIIVFLSIIALASAYEDYENQDGYEFQEFSPKHAAILIPRSRIVLTQEELPLENMPTRILKRRTAMDDGFTKRATASSDRLAAIPRSGLMISGRGWMPGFVDQPRVFKRSVPTLEKILIRPIPVA